MTSISYRMLWSLGAVVLLLTACQTADQLGTTIRQTFPGSQQARPSTEGGVAVLDPRSREHLQTRLTMADFMGIGEKVTNKMLASPLVKGWGDKRPRLILGHVVNNTDDENLRVADIYERIQETIFNSGLVRVVDRSATEFEYVVKPELTSTRQYGQGREEQVHYTMQLKIFKVDGELMGQWSDNLRLGRM